MCQSEHSSLYGSCAVFSFVQPTEKKKLTYREQQTRLRKAVAKHEHLQEGTLLDTLEKGGNSSHQEQTRNVLRMQGCALITFNHHLPL